MERGIETRTFFIPMHEQPVFLNMCLFNGEKYPAADELVRKGLYLPPSSRLKEEEIKYICDAVKKRLKSEGNDFYLSKKLFSFF